MESRILKISFNKSGRGSITPRLILPATIIKNMGITESDREIELIYNDSSKEIVIKKRGRN